MQGFDLIIKPDEDIVEAAEVLVDGRFCGREYRFLLDTGAAKSSVTFDDFTAGFGCMDKSSSSGVFAASSDDVMLAPSIQIGPIIRQYIPVTRVQNKDPHIRNLIGMDILKDYCLHFYFDERRVAVNQDDRAGRTFHPVIFDGKFHPYIELRFGDVRAGSVWDTGASITVADMNFIDRHRSLFRDAGRSTGTDSTGSSVETPIYMLAETSIGDNLFPPHKVAGVDLAQVNSTLAIPMDFILGYSTLSKANWLFDFPNKRWAISKMN